MSNNNMSNNNMSNNNTTPIILLHGLGGFISSKFTSLSLYPLKTYLEYNNYNNVHLIEYPSDQNSIEESLDYVDSEMCKVVNKKSEKIIIIGQSMGGVIAFNMHTKGWNIKLTLSIGSPLHGAKLIDQIECKLKDNLPGIVFEFLHNKIKCPGHIALQNKEKQDEPPHEYRTISLGWFGYECDGCVYKDEAIINPEKNLHLAWADHRTIFLNPRLWYHVHNLISD